MDYEKMLKEGKDSLPEIKKGEDRFTVPKVKGQYEGTKTIVKNFKDVAEALSRDPSHLLKFLQKELAATGTFRNKEVIFKSKIRSRLINEKVQDYIDKYVKCDECGKHDTKMTKEDEAYIVKCQVCGARHSFSTKV